MSSAVQLALIAHRKTETNCRLLEAVPAGIEATLLSPAEALGRLGDGDAALARLDVLPTVDGIEPGAWELARLEAEIHFRLAHQIARLVLEQRHFMLGALLPVLVQPVQIIRQPGRADFQES